MKKFLAILCALVLCLSCATAMAEGESHPKYVFMFIGDGMGNPQVTATQYYLGSIENPDSKFPVPADLSFTKFPYLGLVTTYDSSSFCPDSASTATSMASGKKTLSGVINHDETLTNPYKIITEYAKEAGKKVGVITSVSVDHATPAAYYAKQPSRNDYYDIALQALTGTTVDYLAGGGFKKMNGADGQQKSLLDVAKENGWVIPTTNDEIRSLIATNDRVLATNPVLQDSKAIHYEIDRIQKEAAGEDVLSLADFVRSGINVLDNDNGFFMMCEGGKIDWAGHANDAATSIYDTVALSDAVQVALDFAAAHPGECLIIVTADHETGGMTIGFATTSYILCKNYGFVKVTNPQSVKKATALKPPLEYSVVFRLGGLFGSARIRHNIVNTFVRLSKIQLAARHIFDVLVHIGVLVEVSADLIVGVLHSGGLCYKIFILLLVVAD